LDALRESFGATEGEVKALHDYAAKPKTLDDVPLTELSHGDRRAALQHAVVLSWVDGTQSKEEVDILEKLRAKMNIPPEEAGPLIDAANKRAQELLHLLDSSDAASADASAREQ